MVFVFLIENALTEKCSKRQLSKTPNSTLFKWQSQPVLQSDTLKNIKVHPAPVYKNLLNTHGLFKIEITSSTNHTLSNSQKLP